MATYAAPVVYAVLLWWFSTGLILLLDHAPRRTHPWSMAAATLLLAGALVMVRASAGDTGAGGAYTAFTAALVVWGWQEMSYYMGFISGPRPVACPPSLRGASGSSRRWRPACGTNSPSWSADSRSWPSSGASRTSSPSGPTPPWW